MLRGLALAACFAVLVGALAIAQDEEAAVTTAPSVTGLTGAILTPTTELPPVKGLNLGYHYLNDTLDAAVKLNVAPIPKVELGLFWLDPASPELDEELLVNAKYLFVEEDKKNPAVAAGVIDIGDQVDQTWYGVVSKRFEGEVPITINIGGASGDVLDGFFGSIKLGLHEDVDVIGEYDSSELNFCVRFRPYKNITLDLITVDNRVDREFGFGASWATTW